MTMSQFYARYVPPSQSQPSSVATSRDASKRKHEGQTVKTSKVKKQKIVHDTQAPEEDRVHQKSNKKDPATGRELLKKYSITEFAQQTGNVQANKPTKKGRKERKAHVKEQHKNKEDIDSHDLSIAQLGEAQEIESDTLVEQADQKHNGVIAKFNRATALSSQLRNSQDLATKAKDSEVVEVHGLEAIPQPVMSDAQKERPSFSTLPSWQSNALRIVQSEYKSYSEMGLSKQLFANLKRNQIEKAFPIQSTVIPFLLEGVERSSNDLCISAATGSGKTLSYVIPIIENLRKSSKRGLRAIIVVPTRELVQQVKRTCDICTAGSGLRVVTALGSKSVREEQGALIHEEEVYDPDEYRRQRDSSIDWSTFDLMEELDKAKDTRSEPPIYFVTQRFIKADVLITTPGRLVEHLKNTIGFHLDDVQWLVVDEADRLLNESYQEWIEVVVPALQSRKSTFHRDQILSSMRMDLPPRVVRKILLSATMTQDISKLNALGLQNPKLIVLSSKKTANPIPGQLNDAPIGNEGELADSTGHYHVPPLLSETALTFKHGSDKPLILLQLLERLCQQNAQNENEEESSYSEDDTSTDSESSSSDDSESDSTNSSKASSLSSLSSSDGSSSDSDTHSEVGTSKHSSKQMKHAKLVDKTAEPISRVLIFTKSTASAARLSRLLHLLSPDLMSISATLTRSTASSASSRKALASIRSGKVRILIATDRASRGIDIPRLENVVNYDIPASALTYIHRVGRTARAGLKGQAWTLVEHREGRWFWNEIGGKGEACTIKRSNRVQKTDVKIEDEQLKERYEDALQKLGEEVRDGE